MPNTSSSGGPLSPTGAAPAYGDALNTIIQNWLVPLIGLAGNLVVVYDQPEPPNVPEAGIAWAAVRVTIGDADRFPFVGHNVAGVAGDTLIRNEGIELLASFYDLGSTGQAASYMTACRDAMAIRQNLDPIYAAGIKLAEVLESTALPTLLKNRWQYRVDLPIRLRRQIQRLYTVEDVAVGSIELDANVEAGAQLIQRVIPIEP